MGTMAQALQEHLNKNKIRQLPVKNDHPEQREQMSYIAWLRLAHPTVITLVSPIVKYGGNAKQRLIQGSIQKRMGYIKGTLDIFHCIARGKYHGLVIEMKVKGNNLSDDQIEMVQRLDKEGYCAVTCYSSVEAVKEFERYIAL